ncbi:hypothetical protein GH741_20110 [Aquibacillus halophilus]|uniref:Spore coat protein n=1 Tax=Aquibacillus halophilus TaxID=930132 RepID=A0A6A8DUS6_9BACI|nr:hypothetical protein [Aquibacillus halophilus]MRH44952.1 hypothetical protein [Aquibacillus halophilus]
MANKELNDNLNEISNSLINMHVSDLLNKHNISKESKRIKSLSNSEKGQIKDSVDRLRTQTEAFLANQQNKNNSLSAPSTEDLVKQLQNIRNKSKS